MLETPYLICHKVRGQPAFDVAIKMQIGNEDGWIIPTSGHRAYPYFSQSLGEIVQNDVYFATIKGEGAPDNAIDHYSANDTRPKRSMSELTLEDLEI